MDPEFREVIEEYCYRCASGWGECLAEKLQQSVSHDEEEEEERVPQRAYR